MYFVYKFKGGAFARATAIVMQIEVMMRTT